MAHHSNRRQSVLLVHRIQKYKFSHLLKIKIFNIGYSIDSQVYSKMTYKDKKIEQVGFPTKFTRPKNLPEYTWQLLNKIKSISLALYLVGLKLS